MGEYNVLYIYIGWLNHHIKPASIWIFHTLVVPNITLVFQQYQIWICIQMPSFDSRIWEEQRSRFPLLKGLYLANAAPFCAQLDQIQMVWVMTSTGPG